MNLIFEIGSALVVGSLFVVMLLLPRYPATAITAGGMIVLLLALWANIADGWEPTSGIQGLLTRFSSAFSGIVIVRALSTLALLAISWWIAGFWFRTNSSSSRPIRGREIRTSSSATGTHQDPVRHYRHS